MGDGGATSITMKTIFTGKDFSLTPALNDFLATHVEKLGRFHVDIELVKFELDVDKHHHSGERFRCEGWVHVPGEVFEAGEAAEDMRVAIEHVVKKLSRQLARDHERHIDRRKGT